MKTVASNNVSAAFWIQYIEYVSVLLDFTRSMRDGVFRLYKSSLPRMLPLIAIYDHLNYLKSLTIYIAELNNLPTEVLVCFDAGDFVVKRTRNKFNQVDADHAQEWLVGTSKDSGGVNGITNKVATLQRWALSFHWRTQLSHNTYNMLGLSSTGNQHNEEFPARIKRDNRDEDELFKLFSDMKVFSGENSAKPLHNLITKDVATTPIQNALLGAFDEGLKLVLDFVKCRLVRKENGTFEVDLNAPLSRRNALTMSNLEKQETPVTSEKKIIKADAQFLQRIVVSYEAGRPVDLPYILKHELHIIPLGLFELDGSPRQGDGLSLINFYTKSIKCPTYVQTLKESSHYIYNADVLMAKLGKNKSIKTFGDYADKLNSYVAAHSESNLRVDVLFDRYADLTSKITKKKSSKLVSIRRVLDSDKVPLPKSWNNFLSSTENKMDFARFLSNKLSAHQFVDVNVVTAGGFDNATRVSGSSKVFDVGPLSSNHREADIRAVLHAIESEASTIVVHNNTHGTDIFALLIHFFDRMKCNELWLVSGTSKKYIPIHTVCQTIPHELKNGILAFNALTGSTYTSYLNRITKAGALKVFEKNYHLLEGLGDEILTDDVLNAVEEFLLKCFKPGVTVKTFDEARVWLFKKMKSFTDLPPTSDSIKLHIKRCHWTTYMWKNACNKAVLYKDPTDYGWEVDDNNQLKPKFSSNNVNPKDLFEFVICGCTGKCATLKCGCLKKTVTCTPLCKCSAECKNSKPV